MALPRIRRLVALLMLMSIAGCGGAKPTQGAAPRPSARPSVPARTVIRRRVIHLVDRSRSVRHADGTTDVRRLPTVVRFPHVTGGTVQQRARRYPLIVFAHGYDLTAGNYRRLLQNWARAGFVVAAPDLPGESARAPGGPNRGDILNQPADLRFVVGRLLALSARRSGVLSGVIAPPPVGVAGHSDGGDTALAVAYDSRYRDRRVGAAVILAGADLPGIAPFRFPASGPPLLAVQGSADPINPPSATEAFWDRAPAPKLLLTLPGAGHYGPYMTDRPQLTVVQRMTAAFLRHTLSGGSPRWRQVVRAGRRPGVGFVSAQLRR